ncbi:hypothetical protein QTA58_02535 [Neorhizobium sp. CSC1952]|uniref:helix-turn-helix domain-containing protein n=1 Tax=Neorhizobium sp. CSC1952 TaxID=2978974 RepID=UPI0025A4EDB2|nr:helix-turn-helix domain-containing protein [Rhizobium sp. CSC1952]WJR67662.1 hypothetical protein QTA58_02535 [Rhizobium sp. CSC1952]
MSDRPELPGKNDFAVAFKAIALARGLSGDAKTVAAVIITHFNAKTGQCDPGTDRLAAKAGISTRNVVKATNVLHESGLVVKTRHGGNGFRSSYQPNWSKFREIVETFERPDGGAEIVNKRALSKCTNVHLDSEQTFTLTHIRNSPKKLTHTDGASGRAQPSMPSKVSPAVTAEMINGLVRRSLSRPYASKRQPPSVVDPKEGLRDQFFAAIETLGDTMKAVVLSRLTSDIEREALIAEQKSRGAGLRLVVDRVSGLDATRGNRDG